LDYSLEHLRDFVNKFNIGILRLAADNKLLLYVANEMALSARNVGIYYKIVGIFDYIIPSILTASY
jgi:hypothetical protein